MSPGETAAPVTGTASARRVGDASAAEATPAAAGMPPKAMASEITAETSLMGVHRPKQSGKPAWTESIRLGLEEPDGTMATLSLDPMDNVASALERLVILSESPHVARVAEAFDAAGFELALVGGPVRDAFLSRPVNDLDFTTNATPDQILEVVVPISSVQWDVGRAFGTIGARVDGHIMEITTYRTDAYDGESRKPVVEFGDTLEGDLVRRDFTVNAMALRLPGRTLVDPSGGVEDLIARRLATPTAPEVSFGDDPLRMMRAARFTSQLGFTVDDSVRTAMEELAGRIS